MIQGYYAIDSQVHSFRSHDGRASIADHCRRAVEIGLDELGFSEHKDFDPADPVVDYFDYDAYQTEIEAARREFGDRLTIRAGVEIDYQLWFEDEIRAYLDTHPFDFVIGSVHYVDRTMIMSAEYNATRDKATAYRDYFAAVRDSARSGLFDVLGHLEYANRRGLAAWGAYDPHAYRDALTEVFLAAIGTETALEINTAGLHQKLGVTYPVSDTVKLYAALGGRLLSFGSDAHEPSVLAYDYAHAAQIALENGLTHVCTWDGRVRAEVPLLSNSREGVSFDL